MRIINCTTGEEREKVEEFDSSQIQKTNLLLSSIFDNNYNKNNAIVFHPENHYAQTVKCEFMIQLPSWW
jgi:hypothetical protein